DDDDSNGDAATSPRARPAATVRPPPDQIFDDGPGPIRARLARLFGMKKISAIVGIVLLAVQAASAVTLADLSPAQRARPAKHDTVVLDTLPPGDQAAAGQGGTAVALVRATLEAVWRVLVDYPGHRGLYPSVVDATVLATDANHALVKYVVGVGPFSF